MPTETIALDALAVEPEIHEIDITPDRLCQSLKDISNLQRHATASVLHVLPGVLTAGNVSKHASRIGAEEFFRRTDYIVSSDQMRRHIELCISNGNYPDLLSDGQNRSYVMGLARTGFIGALIVGLLDTGAIPQSNKRIYKERLIDMNHSFREFADSDFAREHGVKRRHLKRAINDIYGADVDEHSKQLAHKLEMGIAAEIATKRYIEGTGAQLGIHVRYGSIEEDSKKMDLVCTQGRKTLGIDVKSGDKNSGSGGEARAFHSPIEEFDFHEYRVRELYPAKESCIGDDFEVKARAYQQITDNLLAEFSTI
jgi:hypothetical protein